MFSTTGGIFFIGFPPHKLKKTTVCLGVAQSRSSNPLLYTQEKKQDENERKQEILPKSQQRWEKITHVFQKQSKAFGCCPSFENLLLWGNTRCWDSFSEGKTWVLLDCHFKTCWVSIEADGDSKQGAKNVYCPEIYIFLVGGIINNACLLRWTLVRKIETNQRMGTIWDLSGIIMS